MSSVKAMLITIKCKECGKENKIMLPINMSYGEWLKTRDDLEVLNHK